MKYKAGIAKKEREQIFRLFLNSSKLKFNEIEKAIKIRSNMVSYHLEKMQEENILEKKEDHYQLTESAEKYVPIFANMIGEKLSPVPVILVAVTNQNKILMIKRNRRPYKDYLSMIGGKMLLDEDFKQASLRIVKDKTGLDTEFISFNSIMQEKVKTNNEVKHNFILFFTKVKVKEEQFKHSEHGELKWFDIEDLNSENTIPSDYWLLKNKLSAAVEVLNAEMNDNEGLLSDFKIQ
jgi:ADP-ribose pyrophosphatase YjhB (NUDIX family)